jgi:hypothetical protein
MYSLKSDIDFDLYYAKDFEIYNKNIKYTPGVNAIENNKRSKKSISTQSLAKSENVTYG